MKFKDFFGIHSRDVKDNCIICQNYDLPLFAKDSENGFFVKTANSGGATVIALKNSFLAGDAVLFLKESGCKRIFLFGSCGGCGDVESGDILMVDKAYNFESFSRMLSFDAKPDFFMSSRELLSAFYKKYPYEDLIKTNSACVSSLILESRYIGWFKENGVCAVDMESSIVFSSAKEIGAQAACFMYAADHIETNPAGEKIEETSKEKIARSRKKLAGMILDFINEK
jgi:purine-nucleoside phosphorylase